MKVVQLNLKRRLHAVGMLTVAVLLSGWGCAGRSQLMPAPGASIMPNKPGVVDTTIEGVEMTVNAEAWAGDPAILDEITPIRITIKNNSGKPLLIRYRDFAIISQKGKYYAALPPFKITGSINRPYAAEGYPIIAEPDFDYDGFMLAPYYSEIYPDIPSIYDDEDFEFDEPDFGDDYWWPYYDPFYYDQYYTYWQTIELPTPRMLRLAIPEGVIKNGGHISGFLYFQEVSPKLKMVDFRADLINAKNGNIFGAIMVPFVVRKVS
jgi:hypothetical protein